MCELLARRTGFRYINAGSIFRQMAEEEGLSLSEFGRRAESDARIDRELDTRLVREAREEEGGVILEGRVTGWMAVRHQLRALKVWLEADIAARARRVAKREGQSPKQALVAIQQRERSEGVRYSAHHEIDIADLSLYDLVIDSAENTPTELADLILAALKAMETEAGTSQ